MAYALSRQQLKLYERTGALFPLPGLNGAELGRFRTSFQELEAHCGGAVGGIWCSQLHLHFPWACALATHPGILNAVEQIVGPHILVHSTTLFCKYPGDANFVSWHQDGYYWELSQPRLVSAWIALTDATAKNGCLRVILGSHRVSHSHVTGMPHPNNMLRSGLAISPPPDESQAVDVVLKGGDFSLHHVNMVHGSKANLSRAGRVGFAVRYLGAGVRQKGIHHEVILARGDGGHSSYPLAARPRDQDLATSCLAHQRFIKRFQSLRGSQHRREESGCPAGNETARNKRSTS